MHKLFIEDLPIQGKKVLMRVDFNVPLDANLIITDATRIEAALPSIRYVLEQNGALILMSHLGRPNNSPDPRFSLAPVAKTLSKILGKPVQMTSDCMSVATQKKIQALKPGEILLLENLRFYPAEEHPEKDPNFAKKLATYGDFYINDAFGTSHRKHSSTYTIAQYFPQKAAAGYLLEKEIQFIGKAILQPKRPFYALIGGAKISSKIGVLKSLVKKVDGLLIGGGMAYTFLKAQEISVGDSPYEPDLLSTAKEILQLASERGILFLLPVDFLIAKERNEQAQIKEIEAKQGIPAGYQGFDIGSKTIQLFSATLQKAKTILWNGPVGVFEFSIFGKGTKAMAEAIAHSKAVTIVGGGDSIAAVNEAGVADKITHISTGGGATLEFIEFGTLPGIEILSEKKSMD